MTTTALNKGGSPSGRKPLYPYDDWLDGGIWEINKGEDYSISTSAIRHLIETAAARRGMKVRSDAGPNGRLVFQAYGKTQELLLLELAQRLVEGNITSLTEAVALAIEALEA